MVTTKSTTTHTSNLDYKYIEINKKARVKNYFYAIMSAGQLKLFENLSNR